MLRLRAQDLQAFPKEICLHLHDVLHDLNILTEPCIAVACDIEAFATPWYSNDYACRHYNMFNEK
jgi:hypothetical protein